MWIQGHLGLGSVVRQQHNPRIEQYLWKDLSLKAWLVPYLVYSSILQFGLAALVKMDRPAFLECQVELLALYTELSSCPSSVFLFPVWFVFSLSGHGLHSGKHSCIFDMWPWRKVDHLWCQHFFVLLAGICPLSLRLLFSQRLCAWFWEDKRDLNVVTRRSESPVLLLSSIVQKAVLKFPGCRSFSITLYTVDCLSFFFFFCEDEERHLIPLQF